MPEFKGKLILITGAARGIGRAAAFEYARAGARVIILDILGDVLEVTASDLRKEGHKVDAFQCDLSSNTEVASLGEKIKENIGVPDILHNNAFFARRIVKAFLNEMIERKSGWIVNTASPNGIAPPHAFAANGVPYNMCKAADISISQSMAAALKEHGIGVSVLYPGAVASDAPKQPHRKTTPEFAAAIKKFFLDNAVTPEEGVKGLIEGVRQGKFLVSTFENFEKVLVEFAQNGLDPNAEYSWPY